MNTTRTQQLGRRLIKSLAALLLFAHVSPCDSALVTGETPRNSLPGGANGGELGSTKMNYQTDLYTGRFTYSIPIVLPPARQNSEPNIGLSYNSSGGNGWCGVGWDLELGHIERDGVHGQPIATDGGVTHYDDAKSYTFTLGGVTGRLVKVSPNGQSPVEYRQEIDQTFLKLLFYAPDPAHPNSAYWDVIDKAGKHYFFGEAAAARMDNPGFNGAYCTTFRWMLDRIRDPNGNEMYITYTADKGNLYPLNISYNANVIGTPHLPATDTVDFILEDRPDPQISFKTGFSVTIGKRLAQIVVKADGQRVCRYALGYTPSPSTYRSLLTTVTQYGNDDVTALPPLALNYQVKPFGFGPVQDWPGVSSQNITGVQWNCPSYSGSGLSGGLSYVRLMDMDGDGLPDRVMAPATAPYDRLYVQRNTGTGFTGSPNYQWGQLALHQGNNELSRTGTAGSTVTYFTTSDLFDIDGDGKPDRVDGTVLTTEWKVQINNGVPSSTGSFAAESSWSLASSPDDYIWAETQQTRGVNMIGYNQLLDLNNDGLPDRVSSEGARVQLSTGSGFVAEQPFNAMLPPEYGPAYQFITIFSSPPTASAYAYLVDMNGDGLPDSISYNATNQSLSVQFNNGIDHNSVESFGPLHTEWGAGTDCIDASYQLYGAYTIKMVRLIDINGDDLPDRVMTKMGAPFDGFKVQLNTGTGFGPLIDWPFDGGAVNGGSQWWNSVDCMDGQTFGEGFTIATLADIDGDGLPDRVLANATAPYDRFKVQLNKGPFPDLLCEVDSPLGGKVSVTYLPSTKYDNRDRTWVSDPWTEGAKSLLPFPVYTVSTITTDDGMGNQATTSYTYTHGMYDHIRREFRGFNTAQVTDPLGAVTRTYLHQGGGGFDDSANGEYQDSLSKQGMPYRIETLGNDSKLYQVNLNRIETSTLGTGWILPMSLRPSKWTMKDCRETSIERRRRNLHTTMPQRISPTRQIWGKCNPSMRRRRTSRTWGMTLYTHTSLTPRSQTRT